MSHAKEREDEVAHAKRVHKRVAEHVGKSDIILRKPRFEIHHRICREPAVELVVRAAAKLAAQHELVEFHQAVRYWFSRSKWWEEWQKGPDHHLLLAMLDDGCLPECFDSHSTADPPTLEQAQRCARERGYNIPEHYLESRTVGYSEHEAWAATVSLLGGSGFFWERKYNDLWRRSVKNVSGQFIVPDPIESNRPPYVIDQLWIIESPAKTIRFLALEIDEPIHFERSNFEKSRKRDVMLAAMGYEVYHVPSWWCAVDPYRVIAQFVTAAGLSNEAASSFIGHELQMISDYVCEHCGELMVRWDDDWIMELFRGSGSRILVHKQCVDEAR